MTSRAHSVHPPRSAVWLINLFASGEQAEEILGDLLEEFSELVSKSGAGSATRWYWRQTWTTIAHLAGTAFRAAPWLMAGTVLGALLLNRLISGLPERAIFAILERYQVYEHHFRVYAFFATDGTALGHVITSLFLGCVVSLAAKGREMVTTIALSLVLFAMTGVAVGWLAATNHNLIWEMLPWNAADWFAILIGGIIVRRLRPGTTARPLAS